jgi:hypothetical protein
MDTLIKYAQNASKKAATTNNKLHFTTKKEDISFLTEIFIFAVTELNMNMIRVFEGKRNVKRKSHIKKNSNLVFYVLI